MRQRKFTNPGRILLQAALIIGCSGGGEGISSPPPQPPPPPPPAQTASLSGFIHIRDAEVETPVAGATITVGSVSATSAQNGRFELPNAPVGSAVVKVTAAGFDRVDQSFSIQAGTNSVTIALLPANAMYEANGIVLYVPYGVSTVRGVFSHIMGSGVDSRPLVRGDLDFYQNLPLTGDVAAYRRRMLTLARKHSFALMGVVAVLNSSGPILQAMTSISSQGGRPELAYAPLILHGGSLGACVSYEFAVLHPERVIGFVVAKAGPCLTLDGSRATAVPGYFIFGELDTQVPDAAREMTDLFQRYRIDGAVWALAVEPGAGHGMIFDQALIFNWMDEVIGRRVPATTTPGTPVQLRLIDPASSWLGDRSSRAIAEYACYAGDKLSASWLPSETTARDWQSMVSSRSNTTVIPCAP